MRSMLILAIVGTCLLGSLAFNNEEASAHPAQPSNTVLITASQVSSAIDIESAIKQATGWGKHPGTVILDGRAGPFKYSGDDRSINIFYSNLTIRGIHGATITNCADGIFFDDLTADQVSIENLTFECECNGVVSVGGHRNVTFKGNNVRAGCNGITVGLANTWEITGNAILAQVSSLNLKSHHKSYLIADLYP
jgi:hypothetical protein